MNDDEDKTTKELKSVIWRLRRTHSGQPDIMALCDQVEKAFGPADPPRRRLHPLWKREPPENP